MVQSHTQGSETFNVDAFANVFDSFPSEFGTWRQMRSRCSNPKEKSYPLYGGRGITVCERWKHFRNFMRDMGPRPEGHSLDRIDSNGNYEPNNCRWATRITQNNNRKGVQIIRFRGVTTTIGEAYRAFGSSVPNKTATDRIRRGWDVEEALSLPPNGKRVKALQPRIVRHD